MSKIICPNGHSDRFTPDGYGVTTAMATWESVDGDGNVVEYHDPNSHTQGYTCQTCKVHFFISHKGIHWKVIDGQRVNVDARGNPINDNASADTGAGGGE